MTSRKRWLGFWIPAVGLGLVLSVGLACGSGASSEKEEAGRAAGAAESAQAAPASEPGALEAQSWLDDFTIGQQVDTEGAIPLAQQGDEFTPGQTVYVAMAVGDAPAGASVEVKFEDASGQAVAQDEKKVPLGAKYLYFDSGDTSSWKPGEYVARISVSGRSVNDQHFTLTPAGGSP